MIRKSMLASAVLLCLAATTNAVADNSRDIIQELDENGVDPPAVARRLTKVTTILDKADNRLDALKAANPDVASNTAAFAPLSIIAGKAENMLASLDAVDHGVSTTAAARRLGRATSTIAGVNARIDALLAAYPPGPYLPPGLMCDASAVAGLDALATEADALVTSAGELDSCDTPASIARRLGHVSSSLDAASARLEGIAAVYTPPPIGDSQPGGTSTPPPVNDSQPGGTATPPPVGDSQPPGGQQPPPVNDRPAINAALDDIIAQANAVLASAEAMRQ